MSDSDFRNPMDALVVGTVQKLVGKTDVGIDDDFFDLGGNSILAIRLSQALSAELGISRATRVIFKNPRLSDLSDALSGLVAS
ncbi:phosphopantetheine-binding protein [Actinoplanes derwentensis]|uniref:Phosphopantetheine attachment site n=1 Tax=Actinoplanes derwentensis TaxID=113562 RepID=A0A1H2CIL9_9ACTN|nr:phosphopantetheine-binding protein [Actinoplanes derwentensis]GID89586.1 hypothetical protein Ade03nite_85100 [Actinoplanes derwentensis]SDT70179.1 Phosphopantetheine attachment site [Actinoplanes derwentensis]